MNIEQRLRSAFKDRSLEVETSPQAIFEINRQISASRTRGGLRFQFRPSYVLAGAACVVLAAVAVLSVTQQDPQPEEVGVFDESQTAPSEVPDQPATGTTDGSGGSAGSDSAVETGPEGVTPPPTTGPASPEASSGGDTTSVGLPSPERARVVWPNSTTPSADWPTSADDAAAGFVAGYLGLSTGTLEAAATNGSTGTAVLKSPSSGSAASTLELAAFDVGDGTKRWAVVAARSAMLSLDEIEVGSVISNPAEISGTAEGLGGAVLARLYAPSESPVSGLVMGQAAATAGNVGTPEAFEVTIGYPIDSDSAAVLVLTNDGALGGVTAIPVTTTVPITQCEPGHVESGSITVAVFFPCENSSDGALVERTHTAPPSGAGLLGALQALAVGPTDSEVAAGLYSALPTNPDFVHSVAESDGWAVVDLGPAVESANGPLALAQLNATAFALPSVVAVEYRIDGDCERFAAAIGSGGCRIYSRAGDFPPPTAYEPQVLVAAGVGDQAIHLDASSSSETVATLVAGGAGGFRLTGATATADGTTWLQVVRTDGSLGWINSAAVTIQPVEASEAQRQLMIDRAGDVVAVGSLGDLGRVALSDKGLWVSLATDSAYTVYLPSAGLRDIGAWTAERDLGDGSYPLGATLAEVFGANSLDVISVNRAAAGGSEPPAAFAGLGFVSIATSQTLEPEPVETDPEAEATEEATPEAPAEPTTAQVIINVYFDFSTGEPQVIALSAHPALPPAE